MQIIKELRKKMGATQTELAKAVGVSLRTIQTYEQEDANIPTKNLNKIAAFLDLNVADLYLRKMNDDEATYGNQKPFNHFGSRCYPLDFGKNFILVPLLLAETQEQFAKSIENGEEQKESMKTGFVVETLHDSSYFAFEVSGDSMNDGTIQSIPNKSIVLGVHYTINEMLKDSKLFLDQIVILVLRDRITCKKIVEVDKERNEITFANLRTSPEFNDFKLSFDEILRVFKVIKKQL